MEPYELRTFRRSAFVGVGPSSGNEGSAVHTRIPARWGALVGGLRHVLEEAAAVGDALRVVSAREAGEKTQHDGGIVGGLGIAVVAVVGLMEAFQEGQAALDRRVGDGNARL